ncbi:MAG: T9SS C-terminal target domain-containing protein, partial [Chitinophagia bacterium]|nr:T9SS C-terminal target domain-containing protein [Chitinophagia bacterium]
ITNGRFEYPTGFCPGTIPFDFKEVQNCPNPDTPAVTLKSNEDRYFCPTFFFETGGGSCRFKFEFIAGGSYNDATDKGSPVILRNVYVNSYDIDGNADCSTPNPASNQYNDFSGFNSAARATPGSRIAASYNSASGMTRFMSISNCNIADIKDPTTRIRVEYQFLQEFEVEVGMTGRGRAFYMFDFGPGPNFTPMMLYSPILDLNTLGSGDGYNNVTTLCSTPERLSKGSSNITSLNNSIEELVIAVPATDIRDGNAEILATDIRTPSQQIPLGTPFTGSQTLTVTGTTYTVTKTVTSSGMRQMSFTKNGGSMTNNEAEKLLDSLVYFNSVNSAGLRRFTIWLRESVVTSTFAFFEVYGGCIVLSASAPALTARAEKDKVWLSWRLGDPLRTRMTSIERVTADRPDWEQVHERATIPDDAPGQTVELVDMPRLSGTFRYRLVETDFFGARRVSAEKVVRISLEGWPGFYPNPVSNGKLNVRMDREGPVSVYDAVGLRVFQARLPAGIQRISIGFLKPGNYTLVTDKGGSPLIVR